MADVALSLIQNALSEIGVYTPGEALSNADAQFALGKLNRMLDEWNSQELFIYARTFPNAPLITGFAAQPLTIGPTGSFMVVPQRPEKIIAANIFLNNTPTLVKYPLTIRDADWWAAQRVPQITTAVPTDLYYEPAWPNGQMFIWPVPTVAWPLELELWSILTQIPNLTFSISLPPAYANALTLGLAVDCAAAFRKNPAPSLALRAQQSWSALQNMNSRPPLMGTSDSGLPKATRNRPTFNYHSGQSTYGSRR
jgi:hypothetical protein